MEQETICCKRELNEKENQKLEHTELLRFRLGCLAGHHHNDTLIVMAVVRATRIRHILCEFRPQWFAVCDSGSSWFPYS